MKKIAPLWYILLNAGVLASLVWIRMIIPYARQLPADILTNIARFQKINLARNLFEFAYAWDTLDFVGGVACLILGLVCLVVGFLRLANKLECKAIFLLAAFAVCFSLYTLIMTEPVLLHFNRLFLIYMEYLTYFAYPIALLAHFFCYLRPAFQKWLLPPFLLLAGYGVMTLFFYFALGLEHGPAVIWTQISSAGLGLFLIVGLFGTKQKEQAVYMRLIAAFWVGFIMYILISPVFSENYFISPGLIHNEFKTAMLFSIMFMTFYTLFMNIRELASYKTGLHILERKTESILESYKTLQSYITQISQMKHEIRNHLFLIKTYHERGETERLSEYLSEIQGSFDAIETPVSCNNHIIQSVFNYAARLAKELNFEIKFDCRPLPPLSFPDDDIVSLFMNLLDNALDSCKKIQDPNERRIEVSLKVQGSYLYVLVVNSRAGEVNMDKEMYVSTKNKPLIHGHGMKIIKSIAKKHNGFASFEHTDNTFKTEVALMIS